MAPTFTGPGIAVDDMAAALAFYRLVGLDIPPGADHEAHVRVDLPGGVGIMFDTIELMQTFDPAYRPSAERGRIGLAFECASPEEVDAIHASLVRAGYRSHLAPWDAFWGQRYATVLDPDGNGIDLFAPSR
jgi:uncharacterized glyoxalase superfamily protein PhnB